MISCRWARPEDVETIARIGGRCFPAYDPANRAENLRNDPRHKINDILVAEQDGQLVGGATLLPLRVWTGGSEYPAGGVASVFVAPDFRRRGVGQVVMNRILEAHRDRSLALSILYPYDPAFYRRLGYATIERWIELRLRTASLPDSDAKAAVRTANSQDLDAIVDCHQRSLPVHNGAVGRSHRVWERRILSGSRTAVIFERAGKVEGYFLYDLVLTGDSLQQVLYIREWVTPDDEAFRGLLGFVAAQQAQCPEMRLFVPADSPLMLFLAEPRSPNCENPHSGHYSVGQVGTGAMARVVDPVTLFATRRRFFEAPLACRFRLVEKGEAAGDAGTKPVAEVGVGFDGETAWVTRESPSAWLECDPGTLAQIFFGAAKVSDAVQWGTARADSPETIAKLDMLFAQRAPFLHPLDSF